MSTYFFEGVLRKKSGCLVPFRISKDTIICLPIIDFVYSLEFNRKQRIIQPEVSEKDFLQTVCKSAIA